MIFTYAIYLIKYIYHRIFTGFHSLGWPVAFNQHSWFNNAYAISIGNRVYIGRDVFLQAPIGHEEFGTEYPKLEIGDNVTISIGTMINAAKHIKINDNVNIAQYCFIGDNDHEYRDVTRPVRDQGIGTVKPVEIGPGTWIASKVTVCSGVKIGKNCVIGANSVVTKDIPDYSVAVGAPAKVIKRFDFDKNEWVKVETSRKNEKSK